MWEIKPLDVGTLTVTKSTQICRHGVNFDVGQVIDEPCIAWLLTNIENRRYILVDTGPCSDREFGKKYHGHMRRTEDQQLEAALKSYGITCEEIDTVILTHLHWDHAYGIEKLPNAKVYIQKAELCHAVAPLRTEYNFYENKICEGIPFFMKFYNQYELLDGDVNFAEGLKIITLPGHSPGSQGVVVETLNGRYIIAGDLVSSNEAWELRLPCGIYSDMEKCLNSLKKIESYNAHVLASHDYQSFEVFKK